MSDENRDASPVPSPSNKVNKNNTPNNEQPPKAAIKNGENSPVNMFKEVCDVDDEVAEQLLRESGGNLEAAIHQFFYSRDNPEVLENMENANHEEHLHQEEWEGQEDFLLRHRRRGAPPLLPPYSVEELAAAARANVIQNNQMLERNRPPVPADPPLTWGEIFRALVVFPFRFFYWTLSECLSFFYNLFIGPVGRPAIGNNNNNRRRNDNLAFHRDQVDVVQDRMLMREQQNEYDQALAIDRQKAQERKLVEQRRLEQERRAREAEERVRARRERLRRKREEIEKSFFGANDEQEQRMNGVSSSSWSSNEFVKIRFAFPNGAKGERRFRHDESLLRLFEAVFIHPECPENFSLMTSYPSVRLNCAPAWYLNEFELRMEEEEKEGTSELAAVAYKCKNNPLLLPSIKTFAEQGLLASAVILVQDNDA